MTRNHFEVESRAVTQDMKTAHSKQAGLQWALHEYNKCV